MKSPNTFRKDQFWAFIHQYTFLRGLAGGIQHRSSDMDLPWRIYGHGLDAD